MGTRHLIAVQIDGQYKIAQYGQWDGYPQEQGATVLEFLKTMDRPDFEAKVRAAQFLTPEESKEVDTDRNWPQKWPQLHRDVGGEILALVAKAPPGIKLSNSIDFAGNSLMCEWAYVIDLDQNTFEVFKGFNKTPLNLGERFRGIEPKTDGYYQVRLAHGWKLDSLPTEEEMIAKADPKQEEES